MASQEGKKLAENYAKANFKGKYTLIEDIEQAFLAGRNSGFVEAIIMTEEVFQNNNNKTQEDVQDT